MSRRLYLAPLDGITKGVFRQVWRQFFGGADRYFLPFFSPTDQHILTPRDRRELTLEPPGPELTPQVMTCRAEDFLWAAETLADLGFSSVNLNLGCPSGTVTAKGKGSGFLLRPEDLDRFLDQVCARSPLPVSVKTRLGYQSPEEFPRLLELFNRYPLECLILHPRTRLEKYRGHLHWDAAALALEQSQNPVCCNGDLQTPEDVEALWRRFPSLEAAMIGRGAVADPALFRRLRGGPAASRKELEDFTAALYRAYQDFYGQAQPAAQRMKEVWFYLIHLFEDGERLGGRMRRSRGPAAYLALEREIFQTLALRQTSKGELV